MPREYKVESVTSLARRPKFGSIIVCQKYLKVQKSAKNINIRKRKINALNKNSTLCM